MKKHVIVSIVSLVLLTIFIAGCDTGTNGGTNGGGGSLIVRGTFTSQVPENAGNEATLSINFGDVTSRDQIPELISGTITDGEEDIPISGAYDKTENVFFLSGGAEYLKYYVEGFLNSSLKFENTKANIALSESGTDGGWSMKEKQAVTNR
jgi:hypothetical protein